MHLTRNLLDAEALGELPEGLLDKIRREHLLARCPTCEPEIAAHEAGRLRAGGRSSADVIDRVERIRRRIALTDGELQAVEQKRRREVIKVFNTPARGRRGKVWAAHSQYRGPLFGVLLLEKAREQIPAKPAEALSLAEAVLVSCERSAEYRPDPEIQAPALAVRGNAKRALGRLRDAAEDLKKALKLLYEPAVTDPATPAEVYSYLGSLRKDQGRFDEAIENLDLAALLYDLLGEREMAARVLLKLGTVHFRRGDFDAAVAAAGQALDTMPGDAAGWLRASAHFNRAHYLRDRGEVDLAEAELAAHEDELAAEGPGGRQHLAWLRARIAWSREELKKAERFYVEVRKLARERGIPFDAALAALELALVHLAQGRTARVKKLALEALEVFAEQEVEREVRTALALLETAARRDAITQELLQQTIDALERARHGRGAPADLSS
ncbi:MAG TPA: tetratricopeptide repeat protein [Thermoanaerobaculia bacterium]|nr:tetratricopeptide repeat protein [Thermoanaerobaculia bacterium]